MGIITDSCLLTISFAVASGTTGTRGSTVSDAGMEIVLVSTIVVVAGKLLFRRFGFDFFTPLATVFGSVDGTLSTDILFVFDGTGAEGRINASSTDDVVVVVVTISSGLPVGVFSTEDTEGGKIRDGFFKVGIFIADALNFIEGLAPLLLLRSNLVVSNPKWEVEVSSVTALLLLVVGIVASSQGIDTDGTVAVALVIISVLPRKDTFGWIRSVLAEGLVIVEEEEDTNKDTDGGAAEVVDVLGFTTPILVD